MRDEIILFDWLSFTTTEYTPYGIISAMGFVDDVDWCLVEKNARGYRKREHFNGVNVHYDNPQDVGRVWVEMSGQGCRAFDEFSELDWIELFRLIIKMKCNATRLDIALDDKVGLLDINHIFRETDKGNYVSSTTAFMCISSHTGKSVQIGSNESEIMFRIYDKARQLEREDEGHWIRFELQLRRERARAFIINLLEGNSVGELFHGVLNHYIRYVHPSKTESNPSRWLSQKWWLKFINSAKKIKLWTKCETDYNLTRAEKHVYRQSGNAIWTLMQIKGQE